MDFWKLQSPMYYIKISMVHTFYNFSLIIFYLFHSALALLITQLNPDILEFVFSPYFSFSNILQVATIYIPSPNSYRP